MVWLAVGDRNTKFFHAQAHQHRQTNSIKGLLNENNKWCTDENEVEAIAINYFAGLFRTNHPGDLMKVISAVNSIVTLKANQNLLRPYTEDEVSVALYQMHPSKALGPDGMSSFFFFRNIGT